MKPPHGLAYAVLIIVAILAVTLYARYQSSSLVAGAATKAQTQQPVVDDAPSGTKSDDDSRKETTKDAEDAPK
jgi:hypothetical protein